MKGDNKVINITKNIINRRKKIVPFSRKLPRVYIDKSVKVIAAQSQGNIHILDFNYEYISIQKNSSRIYKEFSIPLGEEAYINLHCVFDEELSQHNRKDILIYKVMNFKEFINYDLVTLLKSDITYYEQKKCL